MQDTIKMQEVMDSINPKIDTRIMSFKETLWNFIKKVEENYLNVVQNAWHIPTVIEWYKKDLEAEGFDYSNPPSEFESEDKKTFFTTRFGEIKKLEGQISQSEEMMEKLSNELMYLKVCMEKFGK